MNERAITAVRFAPSPTGRLHIGNIRTALYNWLLAKRAGGQFVLRLDDTDQERSTDGFARMIVDDLAWLGINPDRTEKQSKRFALYDAAAAGLRSSGQLYACYETPEEIERRRKRLMARGLPPVYDRAGLRLSDEEKAAFEADGRKPHWRFLLPNFETEPFETRRTDIRFNDIMRGEQVVDLASMSDPVLIRGDGTYLYTLPSVVDDIDMGISHVVRGGDHITNTGVQIALFEALGSQPPTFGHHNLLQDASGEGLSKRSGALSIGSLHDKGLEPMAVASLATLIGTGQPVEACRDMVALATVFDPEKISRSDARFDPAELEGLNEKLLHSMDYAAAEPRLRAMDADFGEAFWYAIRDNIALFSAVAEWRDVINGDFPPAQIEDEDRDYLAMASTMLPKGDIGADSWQAWTGALKDKTGRKGKALFMPLRLALTGRAYGPELAAMLPLIGREETIRRLS